jgi:hypothetical protein
LHQLEYTKQFFVVFDVIKPVAHANHRIRCAVKLKLRDILIQIQYIIVLCFGYGQHIRRHIHANHVISTLSQACCDVSRAAAKLANQFWFAVSPNPF